MTVCPPPHPTPHSKVQDNEMTFTTSLSNWSVLCEMFQNALSLLQHTPLCSNETKVEDCLHTAFNTLPSTSTSVKHAHAEGMKGNSNSITLLKCLWNQKQERNRIAPKDSKTQEAECQSLYVQ